MPVLRFFEHPWEGVDFCLTPAPSPPKLRERGVKTLRFVQVPEWGLRIDQKTTIRGYTHANVRHTPAQPFICANSR